MNPHELMNQITNLGAQINAAAARLAAQASDSSVSMEELRKQKQQLTDMNERMAALQESYKAALASAGNGLVPIPGAAPSTPRSQRERLASNEYARAFAYAIQNGITRKNGVGNEKVKILYDALTEGGGNPAGSNGGFLVPEDVEHDILEQRRQLDPLAALFNVEPVTSPTGWRVRDAAPTKGLVDVDEMGQIDDDDDQPFFVKVPYTCSKKALILPVSNELMSDNVAILFAYLSRWYAKKLVITENTMLIAALRTLTAKSIASDPLAGLKTALNKGLDPAVSTLASVILNQSGFDLLDQMTDEMGRGLLQPDPTSATVKRFSGRALHAVSNATMGDVTTGSGSSAVITTDLFIGDGKEFATLFRCGGFELAATDIGGDSWRTDSTELRGITRLGVSKFDEGAMVRRTLTLTE